MRQSSITSQQDTAGEYEVEVFDYAKPKFVIVCVHGTGVRRWDGEQFFYAVAPHYRDSAVLLVDLNQQEVNGVKINPLSILVSRTQGLINQAKKSHPGVPIVIIAHSMGCGVVTQTELKDISAVFFVAPAVGTPQQELIDRHGPEIVNGKTVTSSDGLIKTITADYYSSLKGITWEDEYSKLVRRYSPVHTYEAADDEILDDRRFAHRTIPFASYEIIKGAKHNFSGQPVTDLFQKIDSVLEKLSQ